VSLPGASELFGGAAPKQTRPEKRTTTDESAPAGVRSRTAVVDDRKSSGRVRHDTKITVYVTEEELIGLEQARLALRARIVFGRGMGHGGVLNFGDAFSYALARARSAPLLFVGDDFATTDVEIALAPDPD